MCQSRELKLLITEHLCTSIYLSVHLSTLRCLLISLHGKFYKQIIQFHQTWICTNIEFSRVCNWVCSQWSMRLYLFPVGKNRISSNEIDVLKERAGRVWEQEQWISPNMYKTFKLLICWNRVPNPLNRTELNWSVFMFGSTRVYYAIDRIASWRMPVYVFFPVVVVVVVVVRSSHYDAADDDDGNVYCYCCTCLFRNIDAATIVCFHFSCIQPYRIVCSVFGIISHEQETWIKCVPSPLSFRFHTHRRNRYVHIKHNKPWHFVIVAYHQWVHSRFAATVYTQTPNTNKQTKINATTDDDEDNGGGGGNGKRRKKKKKKKKNKHEKRVEIHSNILADGISGRASGPSSE